MSFAERGFKLSQLDILITTLKSKKEASEPSDQNSRSKVTNVCDNLSGRLLRGNILAVTVR